MRGLTTHARFLWRTENLGLRALLVLIVLASSAGIAHAQQIEVAGGGSILESPTPNTASLAYVPPVWVLAAIAVALFGVLPRWTALAWAPLAVCVVIGMFGTLLGLPQAVLDVSPFEQAPSVPAAGWDAVPIVVLVAVAAAVTSGGLVALRRRDVPA